MYHIIDTKMICSKCKSDKIVAPCNEDEVDFRCLDCGYEKKRPEKLEAYYWESEGMEHVIEI